ncbi:hypothetical protein FGB62_342g06 [Gracilaria domingensis]|nr:hypothetical protein FGB62_342g06 [Gracilaria domingensis]
MPVVEAVVEEEGRVAIGAKRVVTGAPSRSLVRPTHPPCPSRRPWRRRASRVDGANGLHRRFLLVRSRRGRARAGPRHG